ncbi:MULTISPECIES: DUF4429 domain-containing protein [Bacillus]|uniref:DUF4429 domain-containing protein n=1 Tax=Bacillus wiedmannii TaxID=1890302 RepID=A0AB37YTV6_9BACI|nr:MULTISPECIES: DUF4429 domain-containing protein [Bacillus]EJS68506.1 hypothetical protein ICW_03063 [Bacillus wiedmannii]OOR22725.1 hypothetical protein BW893_29065 [Bacillus wiedmannii]PEJ40045.1 hypothetical protein CN889_18005 [Bacillus wiedmannii]PEO19818.1 hypothetical protein CN546_07715 [Bacillus wiedmannii]UNK31259.1 SHOCT domain-containing protein [Bacillus sp. N5-665]
MEATGVNGQLQVEGNKIVIKRKGVLAKMSQGLKGDKEILIKHLSSIQFKPAGIFTNGYIQFSFSGGKENKGGLFDATKDENSIMFSKKQQPNFLKLKALIEQKMDEQHSPAPINASGDVADQIKKLADLRDSGILTNEEFDAKKKQLLGI